MVTLEGIGLHLGRTCRLTFRPAEGGRGRVFRRVDLAGAPETPAHVDHAVSSERRTQLGEGDGALHTVEHVLAAVAGQEIDDLIIEMDAPEPPILDGSAAPFGEALERAGIAERPGPVQYLDLAGPVCVTDVGVGSTYEAHPALALRLEVAIDFPHPLIGAQSCAYAITRNTFARELAPARTFGFLREVEELRRQGLIQGASTENAVVLDDAGLVGTTLRWPDEFVRHKAMDCVGDLALAGRRVRARIVATKPSHRGTVTLVREMIKHAAKEPRMIGIEKIMEVLPHRYPFLLVDRVLELEPGKRVVGLKNVTINEPFFQGHFPGHPIMPGVLIIEAMAQVGGMLLMGAFDNPESKVVYFMSLDNVKFRKPVRPGDQLRFELEINQIRGRICKMRGVGYVDGEVVAEADMAAMVRDR
ncbi:MAG: UDP-3-O-acyl-N-acetylglucosamine deacetylase [Gemmatimonadota bacterium]|nr:UDP-3-O-acyl-N-acetylglucosamine deacetylase [Gemmatimonadota bacterium]